MSIEFSNVVATRPQGQPETFSVRSIDLRALGEGASPIVVLDDFRVSHSPFGPHPHAGFAAVTYVFEDSKGSLRSRDSLGDDVIVGPGGIVWTQAGSGILHEEVPADAGRELHGLQVFVNLSSKNKFAGPRMLRLDAREVPESRSADGDRVRVVVGSFEGISSPLVPTEPFTFLDVELQRQFSLDIERAHNALVYVFSGAVLVRAGVRAQEVPSGHALALHAGDRARATFQGASPTRFVVLSGAELREPVVVEGPFIMNERSQIEAAAARYRRGEMGELSPLSNG